MYLCPSFKCRSCDQHFNSCEQLKVHVCKLSEPENYNEKVGKAVGETEERGQDVDVVEVERTEEKMQRPESLKAHNDIQHLLGSDNMLIKGVASEKEGEERSPPCPEKRAYNVLYETEESLKNSDSGR